MKALVNKPVIKIALYGAYVCLSYIMVLSLKSAPVAAITNNRDNIPSSMTNGPGGVETLTSCYNATNGITYNYAQYPWISMANAPTTLTANVSQGTSSVVLQFNSLSAVCNNNIDSGGNTIVKDKVSTRTNIVGATATTGSVDLAGKYTTIEYGLGYAYNVRYFKDWDAPSSGNNPEMVHFTLSGIGSLPVGLTTITVSAIVREIHYGTDGNFKCVDPATASVNATSISDVRCGVQGISIPVTINVLPTSQNPRGVVQADCNTISGWARDDDVSGPIEVHLYFDGMATGKPGIIADRPHPTEGSHGYSYPMPSITLINPYDGNTHTVRSYGINQ